MQRTRFNDGWSVRPKANAFAELVGGDEPWTPVEVPHDAMLGATRNPSAGAANGFFPGGTWEYTKAFPVPVDHAGKRVFVEFEGVYRSALVFVNGALAAHRPYGYSGFTARIDELVRPGEENTLRVEVTAGDDSRWYSGAGIYRNVHLVVGDLVHVALDGLRVTTRDVDQHRAVVEVSTVVENDSVAPAARTVVVEITGPDGAVVARGEAPVTTWPGRPQTVSQRIAVTAPERWSVDSPSLYSCTVVLRDGPVDGDRASTTFGIRTLQLDPERGLRINGEPVKLRGACVHHDNGILGAATIERAEERRVELLKAAGFNALRSAHNPMSEAMLDACDRMGMLVMDEAFDAWTEPKMTNDYARSFGEWWEQDLAAMVSKDVNHPSVILYSIGNEIQEVGRPDGARRGREMADSVRRLDPTRFVTNAINPVLACGPDVLAAPDTAPLPDLGVNTLMTIMQEYLPRLLQSDVVAERLEESFAALDVAGYNYLETRYEMDGERYPHRVIVGTETMPPLIGRYWPLVRDNPHVIGDFTWTGWDYLGEAGIGRIVRGAAGGAGEGMLAAYPWLIAGSGDLDITGFRRPASYLREIAFGLRTEPYLAVQRPDHHDSPVVHHSPWALTDAVASWSWPDAAGCPVTVEVYAAADEVELLVNDAVVGRAPVGASAVHRATFETTYRPGRVEAVAYRDGEEVGRTSLRSAGDELRLAARADRSELRTDGTDLAFVEIALTDADGVTHVVRDRSVAVSVDGSGTIKGLGSANPCTEETFLNDTCRTFDGRALAVIGPTDSGPITVTITAEGCAPATVTLRAD